MMGFDLGKLRFSELGRRPAGIAVTKPEGTDISHTLIVGMTGRGRSAFLDAMAKQGVTCQQWEPSEEERQAAELRAERKRAMQVKRSKAVRDAYWAATDVVTSEFASLKDCLSDVCEREVTIDHVRKLFDMLPDDIVGEGIKWTFSDTVVGDNIYCFIRDNKGEVLAAVFGESS